MQLNSSYLCKMLLQASFLFVLFLHPSTGSCFFHHIKHKLLVLLSRLFTVHSTFHFFFSIEMSVSTNPKIRPASNDQLFKLSNKHFTAFSYAPLLTIIHKTNILSTWRKSKMTEWSWKWKGYACLAPYMDDLILEWECLISNYLYPL